MNHSQMDFRLWVMAHTAIGPKIGLEIDCTLSLAFLLSRGLAGWTFHQQRSPCCSPVKI